MIFDRAIINGRIVTPNDTFFGDIYIKDGVIAAITAPETKLEAFDVVDASGLTVMPGFIDTHVHSRDGFNGAHYKEDFFHSTMAAAAGGFTTIYEMPNCNPAIYNVDMLNRLIECVTPKAHVDFCAWGLCLGDLNAKELDALSEAGVCGFKFFWGYAIDSNTYQLVYNYRSGMKDCIPPLDRGEILRMFKNVAKTGKLLGIHAEDFDIIKALTQEVLAGCDRSYAAMLRSRPTVSETSIIESAISYAKASDMRLHILHLAAGDGVELIRRAQHEGFPVTGETCPHYLALSDEDGDRLGSVMKGYPPVREKRHQELLWQGLIDGTLSHVCSDHAPHSPEEKAQGLFDAPAGMAAIETMSLIMLNAVNAGRITENKLVSLLSENPAKLFGAYPKKGALMVGSDADMVLLDMDAEYTFDRATMHSRTKLSPYHGLHMKGRPVHTILRGRSVCENGDIKCAPFGRFVPVK